MPVTNTIIIEPSSKEFCNQLLFDQSSVLNRDNCLTPFIRLRGAALARNIDMYTADRLFADGLSQLQYDYYSLGISNRYKKLLGQRNITFKGFLVFEPPVVRPDLYRMLPELSRHFEKVYLHNVVGDGYSLKNVERSRLAKFYWPQPFSGILEKYWNKRNRQHKIVVINGNHKPKAKQGELYSKRIEAMLALSKFNCIDLFGVRWNSWKTRSITWWPYLVNRKRILQFYHGSCASKYEVLSNYKFALCFENMSMDGYITEKIFDCLYVGTIPLYLGAKDIDKYIPKEAYIDCRKFSSWDELWLFVKSMSEQDIDLMREAGRIFFTTDLFKKFYYSLENCFELIN